MNLEAMEALCSVAERGLPHTWYSDESHHAIRCIILLHFPAALAEIRALREQNAKLREAWLGLRRAARDAVVHSMFMSCQCPNSAAMVALRTALAHLPPGETGTP